MEQLDFKRPQSKYGKLLVTIKGVTPLLCNRMAPWEVDALPPGDPSVDPASTRKRRTVDEVFQERHHVKELPDGGAVYGFPVAAVKGMLRDAAVLYPGKTVTKVGAKADFKVSSLDNHELLTIRHKEPPRARVDHGNIGGRAGSAARFVRSEFPDWEIDFVLQYNSNNWTLEKTLEYLNSALEAIGLGSWTNPKGGSFGEAFIKELALIERGSAEPQDKPANGKARKKVGV